MAAQDHATASLPAVGHPESLSLLLLAGALVLLALLGGMPLWARVLALTAGPLCWWHSNVVLRAIGENPDLPPPPGGYQASPVESLASFGFVVLPLALVGVGCVLLIGAFDRQDGGPADRLLGIAWLAMAAGWPVSEFFLLLMVYPSHDAPPGTGLLRAVLTLLAAALVLWPLVARRTRASRVYEVVSSYLDRPVRRLRSAA